MAAKQQLGSKVHERNRVREVLLTIMVLVAAVVAYFEIGQPLVQGDAPAAAVRQMCAAEMRHDYLAVYALLSSRFIQRFNLNAVQFVESQQGRDQQFGPVQTCAIAGRDYGAMLFDTGAAFRVTATLGGSGSPYTDTGTIRLVNEHGWKISDVQIDDIFFFAG